MTIEDFRHLLCAIQRVPHMYIGKKSVSDLHLFMCGVMVADGMARGEVLGGVVYEDFGKFQMHAMKKARRKHHNIPAFVVALEKAKGDEEAGFDLWFSWYESYLKENGLEFPKPIPLSGQKQYDDPSLY